MALALIFQDESLASSLALHPTEGSEIVLGDMPGIKKCSVIFAPAADGSKLSVWTFSSPENSKLAIVSHGNAGNNSNRLYLVRALSKAGLNVLLYDYRGFGQSTGKPTLKGILEDGDSIYEFATRKLAYAPENIVLYGESIGTAVTCHLAAKHYNAGIILQSPILSLPAAAKFVFLLLRVFPDSIFPQPRLNNQELIAHIHAPILFLHGLKDRIVSPDNSKVLWSEANQPKTLVFLPSCGHNDMGLLDGDLFNSSITKFINSLK
jgi:fermentation-respiration switch protein FrsA (DUF1100 family)